LQFGDDLGRLKLAEHVRWPHTMGSAFANGCVVNTHEFEGWRHRRSGPDQRILRRAALGQRKLYREDWVCLG